MTPILKNQTEGNLNKKQLVRVISAACLMMSGGTAFGVACPAVSGGMVIVGSQQVTATCTIGIIDDGGVTVPPGIAVIGTGSIVVAGANGINVLSGHKALSVLNNRQIRSDRNAIQVNGRLQGNIDNRGTIASTGTSGGTTYEGIKLGSAIIEGGINNYIGATISAVGGNAIHVTSSQLGTGLVTGIYNEVGAEIVARAGYAAILIDGASLLYADTVGGNSIVNDGHIGTPAGQDGAGLQILDRTQVYGNISNSGTIDAIGNYGALTIDRGVVVSGNLINSGLIDASQAINAIELTDGDANDRARSSVASIKNLSTGTINADFVGVLVRGSSVTGGILNEGTINANFGVYLVGNGYVGAAGILNQTGGTINAGQAIVMAGSRVDGSIINRGTITATTAGIEVYSGSIIVGNVDNASTGSISAPQDAILFNASTLVGSIVNSGTLTVNGVAATADQGNAITLVGSSVDKVSNNLNGAIISSNGSGIYANNTVISTGISNSGTITGASGISLAGGSSITSGGIVNSGTISGTADGVRVSDATAIGGGITNTGTISGVNALNLTNTGAAFTVTNSGTLTGNVQLGKNRLDILGSGIVTGNVVGGAGSIVNIATDSTHTGTFTEIGNFAGLDQFNIITGSTFRTNNGVSIGAATMTNAGTLSIADGQTVNLTGNYVQAAGGLLHTDLLNATTYGKLNVSGNVNLSASNAIDVNVLGAPVLAIGEVLSNVIVAGGTLNTGGAMTITDNSAIFNFRGVQSGNVLNLVVQSSTPTVAVEAVKENGNPSAAGAAVVFDNLITNGTTGDMTRVVTALGTLGSNAEVANAITQTVPLNAGASGQAILSSVTGFSKTVQSRQDANSRQGTQSGLSGGDMAYADKSFWFKPIGSWATQDNRNGVLGYDADSYGMIFGFDASVSNVNKVGLAFAYAKTDVSVNSTTVKQSSDISSYSAMLYGSHNLSETVEMSFQSDVGFHKTEGKRNITFGGLDRRADANYDTWSGHVGAKLGKTIALSQHTNFTPSIGADYTYIKTDSYSESGADALNLNVRKNTAEALVLGVNGNLSQAISKSASFVANIGIGYDLINDQSSITSAFAGAPSATFITRGIDPSPWLARGGFGIVGNVSEGVEISANYNFELRDDFYNQTASVKARWRF